MISQISEEDFKRWAETQNKLNEAIALLRQCKHYVENQCEAEHMLDGFSPRKKRPSDNLMNNLEKFLAENQEIKLAE